MKLHASHFLLSFLCALATGCCNDCDLQDDRTLSIQVFDKTTGGNTTANFSSSNFYMAQTVMEGVSLIPSLEFKQNEIAATFPFNCGQKSAEASFDVVVDQQPVDRISISLKTITDPCCNCNHSAAIIATLTSSTGSEVVLSPGANVLKIKL